MTDLGDRLSTAADAAWKALTEANPGSNAAIPRNTPSLKTGATGTCARLRGL